MFRVKFARKRSEELYNLEEAVPALLVTSLSSALGTQWSLKALKKELAMSLCREPTLIQNDHDALAFMMA